MSLTFVAFGRPIPQGSHIRTRYGLRDSNPELKPWRQTVACAAIEAALLNDVGIIRHAVHVRADFFFARPKAHYRSGKNSHLLRDEAPAFPTGRGHGDLDKQQRGIGDALVDSGVLADDSLIVHWCSRKHWAAEGTASLSTPGVLVEISEAKP